MYSHSRVNRRVSARVYSSTLFGLVEGDGGAMANCEEGAGEDLCRVLEALGCSSTLRVRCVCVREYTGVPVPLSSFICRSRSPFIVD